MKELLLKPLQATSQTIGSLAFGIGLVGLLATAAIAQQRPTAEAAVCSTSTQSCANAILADGPLSVSADESNQLSTASTNGLTLEQISNSVNAQTRLEETPTRLGVGPLEINSGDRSGIGIRSDVQD